MAKKVFAVYLAKEDVPNSEAYATLELPASPWELWDAMEKVRLKDGEALYMEIDDYYAFEYLAPHLEELDISLNELNDLAARLATLDEVQGIAFEGLFSMEVQKKVNTNGGIITMQDMRDLAVSAKTDCYHVVEAADDAQLGRFYAENGFISELDGISDGVFEMLDFAGIGRMMRHSENGVFVNSLYVLQDGELTTAPPVQKALPEKPGYLFRLTLGLHPDIGGNRTTELDLPASEEALAAAQEQLGTLNWENTVVLNYTAVATYTGSATSSYVKGYTVTADYTGTVSRIALNRVRYVAIFEGTPIQPAEPANVPSAASAFRWSYVLIPLGIVAAAGAGVGGALLVKHRKENADEEETEE